MSRFVRVLATSALAAGSCLPSMLQGAMSQTTLPTVTVTGGSSGGGSSDGFSGAGFGGYGGGGGCQSCGGYPEGEFGGGKPAPPPKTEAQKQQERAKCEAARVDGISQLQIAYTAQMNACASRNSTTFGYFSEQVKRFLHEVPGVGRGDCSTTLTRQYMEMLTVYDRRRDACLKAVDGG